VKVNEVATVLDLSRGSAQYIVACFPHAVTVDAIETSKGMQQ
jgi:hypothetical protein